MSGQSKVIHETVSDHLETDAAFEPGVMQVRREPLPGRGHKLPPKTVSVTMESPRFDAWISTGEKRRAYTVNLLFALRKTQKGYEAFDDMMGWVENFLEDFEAKTTPLHTASDAGAFSGTGSAFERVSVVRFDQNPAPLTDHPKHHGMAAVLDVFLCERRGA